MATSAPAARSTRYARDPQALVSELLHLPDGRPFGSAMAPFQRSDFEAYFTPGAPPNAWVARPRGGSKSTDAAAVAITDLLLAPDRARLYGLAVDVDQAALLMDSVADWTHYSPALEEAFQFQTRKVINGATGTELVILPSDAPSARGLRPFRIYLDEIVQHPNRGMFDSLVTASHKIPGCRLLITSTAGSPAHWSYPVWEWANESPQWLVRESHELAPWTDLAKVEDHRGHLPPSIARREYENRWVAGEENLFTVENVDDCIDSGREPETASDGNSRYRIGVDLGLVHDRTAVAVVKVGRKNRPHELVYLWWRRGSKDAPVQIDEVEDQLEGLHRRFHAKVLVDEWEMQGSLQRLRGLEGLRQTSEQVSKQSASLLGLIRDRRLRLLPDPVLREELLSLVVRDTSYGWRFDHPSGGFNDLATAVAIAAWAAEQAPRGQQVWVA
jgi:hypothetical protein